MVKCRYLLSAVFLLQTVYAQFKVVDIDSSNFRMKKGVFQVVQINHYDTNRDQSRAFTMANVVDPKLIKVHIHRYHEGIGNGKLASLIDAEPAPSRLLQLVKESLNRRYTNRSPVRRSDIGLIEHQTQRADIVQENNRILKKLKVQSENYQRPTRIGTYVSKCKCVLYGDSCPKLQISVARCPTGEILCCF